MTARASAGETAPADPARRSQWCAAAAMRWPTSRPCTADGALRRADRRPRRGRVRSQEQFQRGIDIDLYAFHGQQFAASAEYEIRYISTVLHANAVSVSFPYFMDGRLSNTVHATAGTPTPGAARHCSSGTRKRPGCTYRCGPCWMRPASACRGSTGNPPSPQCGSPATSSSSCRTSHGAAAARQRVLHRRRVSPSGPVAPLDCP